MDDFNTKLNELHEMYRNLEKDYKTLSKKINSWSKDMLELILYANFLIKN